MRLAFRIGTGIALSLALFAGDLPTLSLSPAPAAAQRYGGHHGGGYYGHGGYGGYRGGYYGGRRYYGGGGFGFGDFLLGAAVVGGVAAIASANSGYGGYGYDTYQTYPAPVYVTPAPVYVTPPPVYVTPPAAAYNTGPAGYDNGGAEPQQAQAQIDPVQQCSRAAEVDAQARGGIARVTGIDHVDNNQTGARVSGRLEVNVGGDQNGNNSRVERSRFDCTAQYGQITALRLS